MKGLIKKDSKETINLISLIFGIFLIILGLGSIAIVITTKEPLIITPISLLVLGAVLSILGGLRKWG